MFEKQDENRGQVGIGTLIVFIAMVLVAAIAAGVLIETAGLLQGQAENTGEESTQQVADRVQVSSAVGQDTNDDDTIDQLEFTIQKAPGAGTIDLSDMTIGWLGTESHTLTSENDSFTTSAITSGTDNSILEDSSDRISLTINSTDDSVPVSSLSAGSEVELTFTTASGAEEIYTVNVPEPLVEDTVSV